MDNSWGAHELVRATSPAAVSSMGPHKVRAPMTPAECAFK